MMSNQPNIEELYHKYPQLRGKQLDLIFNILEADAHGNEKKRYFSRGKAAARSAAHALAKKGLIQIKTKQTKKKEYWYMYLTEYAENLLFGEG